MNKNPGAFDVALVIRVRTQLTTRLRLTCEYLAICIVYDSVFVCPERSFTIVLVRKPEVGGDVDDASMTHDEDEIFLVMRNRAMIEEKKPEREIIKRECYRD